MIKLVLIDFDDTLCLTEKGRFIVENYVAEKMGFPPMTRETHIKYWGKKTLKESILDRIPGIDAKVFMEELERALPQFIENGTVDVISEVNLKTLDKLRERGLKTGILTSRSFMEVKHLLDKDHPLTTRIDAFYHKDNTDYVKPNPKVYDNALNHFNLRPDEVVYIGDNISDGTSAKGAGMHFIALLESELKTKEDFKSVPVDYFALKFSDIVDYLDKAQI